MRIDKLYLQNFRCYDNLEIDFDKNLTLIVGANGNGKTAILDALAIALGPYLSAFGSKGRNMNERDVRKIKDAGSMGNDRILRMKSQYPVVIQADGINGEGKSLEWKRELKTSRSRTTSTDAKQLSDYGKLLCDAVNSSGDEKVILPALAYYGTSRMWNDSKLLDTHKMVDLERSVGYEECLEPSSSYNTFGQWFKYAVLSAAEYSHSLKETKSADKENPYEMILKAVRQAIVTCLKSMGWSDINYSFALQDFVLYHPDMGELTIEALSDGARSVISMAADLAYRMVRLNPDLGSRAALDTPGIVLIDEVDMHLHPSWQQTVMLDLQQAFPSVQFIATTHSPQVLSTVGAEKIRILEWDSNGFEGVRQPEFSLGAESYQLLKEIQNVDTRPQALPIVKDLGRYLELLSEDKWDTDEAINLRKRLDEWSKGRDPVLLRADMDIRMRSLRRKQK
ncbi:MAG: AAA family ATPase [Phascolarctobacterium sp.]|nr:AAA family ATPase [Phascolarctobacterium sp.]